MQYEEESRVALVFNCSPVYVKCGGKSYAGFSLAPEMASIEIKGLNVKDRFS